MFEYIKGKVSYIYKNAIILEAGNIGYRINVTNDTYKKEDMIKLYTFYYFNETNKILYGFDTPLEKEVFYKLINIKNVGVKTAFNILINDDYKVIINACHDKNYDFLLTLNKINENNVDLLIKNILSINVSEKIYIDKVFLNSLKSLEYSDRLIYEAYKVIDKNKGIKDQIKEAINLIDSGVIR